jgi:Xaa-Pro aminopeptidase
MTSPRHRLIELEWPRFGEAARPQPAPATEYHRRLERARASMEERGLTHLVVYGDREHFANLAYLTNFDPRYEEALLVLSRQGAPLAVVGNECENYLPVSPLHAEGSLRHERFQPFSLIDQPRDASRPLAEIFAGEGIGDGARVGCVGWKYFTAAEHPRPELALELPAFIVDCLRGLCGHEAVVNATDLFMRADGGLRTSLSVWEIAQLEYANGLASEGVRRILFGLREGMRDDEAAALCRYDAYPLGAHMTVRTGTTMISLSSPSGAVVRRGNRFSCSLCYRGANVCRAGWVGAGAGDLPPEAAAYVAALAGPYFEAMGAWYRRLDIGAAGGDVAAAITGALPFERFGVFLNPGHLIHLDEWVSSPFYAGSAIPLRSGMAIQADVIPSSKIFYSSRMEEGLVLADDGLQRALEAQFPECLSRCRARRRFLRDTLGLELADAVLPLSNIPGLVPPYLLRPQLVLALER